jgi:hypothetical protein
MWTYTDRLLTCGPKSVITHYSIVAALNADLRGAKLRIPNSGLRVIPVETPTKLGDMLNPKQRIVDSKKRIVDCVSTPSKVEAKKRMIDSTVKKGTPGRRTRMIDPMPTPGKGKQNTISIPEQLIIDSGPTPKKNPLGRSIVENVKRVCIAEAKPSVTVLESRSEKLSVEELAEGFIDENGDEVWIIEDVVGFCPTRGYKVKWIGWKGSYWNLPKDMPSEDAWLNGRMARARYMHFCGQ